MILHQSRVSDSIIGGRHSDTALGFLHDDGQDEAMVDAGRLCGGFDGVVDVTDFLGGVVGLAELSARFEHEGFVGVEHVVE